ncbi:MAG: general secretion pathway protein GspK [Candidatus Omnitrophica bacterium]|nr:general secretion pathway protein GspK [Candidatus Omnitrophota bacterium]
MGKRAQVLIIFIWILIILAILAVGIAYRASVMLKFARYQKDRQIALALAKAGISRATAELRRDNNNYDCLTESWADSEEIFKKIMLNDNKDEFAAVSYMAEVEGKQEIKFGVVDEEKKININRASQQLLVALLEDCNINSAQELARNILIWRGKIINDAAYESLGYPPKKKDFTNTEELMLVKDITPQDYQKLKGMITVYTGGPLNINTVSGRVLKILGYGLAKEQGLSESFAARVVDEIIALRTARGCFTDKNQINITTTGAEELNIFNRIMENLVVKSNNFSIEASGRAGKIEYRVFAIYSRSGKRILYWHEN